MEITLSAIDAFFEDYEKLFNRSLQEKPDVENIVKAFASCFMEASPVGINCGKNDDEFRKKIPQGYEFYKKIGTQSMTIRSKQTTRLELQKGEPKIFAYITGDEQRVLKERGLI